MKMFGKEINKHACSKFCDKTFEKGFRKKMIFFDLPILTSPSYLKVLTLLSNCPKVYFAQGNTRKVTKVRK